MLSKYIIFLRNIYVTIKYIYKYLVLLVLQLKKIIKVRLFLKEKKNVSKILK